VDDHAASEDEPSFCCLLHRLKLPRKPQSQGFGFRVSGFGFRVSGFGFRVSGFGFRVSGFGFRVLSFGFRVLGLGFSEMACIRPAAVD
jgi:hypothetical protein